MPIEHHSPEPTLPSQRDVIRVRDDLAPDMPITAAELDAIEAFLMPLVEAILHDDNPAFPAQSDRCAAR